MALLRNLKPGQIAKVFRGKWRGMAPDRDPTDLSELQPFLAINTRIDGDKHVLRGGQTLVNSLGGIVTGLSTHKVGPFKSLYSANYVYDEELNGSWGFIGGVGIGPPTPFGGDLLFKDGSTQVTIWKSTGINTPGTPLIGMPGGFSVITAMIDSNGTLLIALQGTAGAGTGTSAIFSFDGTTLTKEIDGINPAESMALFDEKTVALFSDTGQIRVRSGGVWGGLISPSAGSLIGAAFSAFNSCQYRELLFIPGLNNDLYVYDQSGALTQYPRATTLIDVGGVMRATTMLNGVMYFLWDTNPLFGANGSVYVGSYDGTTWTPKLKTLLSAVAGAKGVWMVAYRGRLVANLLPDFNYGYFLSPTNGDQTGAWTGPLRPSGNVPPGGQSAVIF